MTHPLLISKAELLAAKAKLHAAYVKAWANFDSDEDFKAWLAKNKLPAPDAQFLARRGTRIK